MYNKKMKLIIGIVGLLSTVLMLANDLSFAPLLAFGAVIGGTWTPEMALFRRGLSKKLEKVPYRVSKWADWTQDVNVNKFRKADTYAGAMSLPKPTNLIYQIRDYQREGGIYMDIPVQVPLTAQGRVGSAPLRGYEEKRKILLKRNAINQIRHGVEIQDSKMSKQVLQKPQIQMALMERAYEDLRDWFTRKLAIQPYLAIMQGYSDNITDPTFGLNLSPKSHPNIYVAGSGKVAFSGVFNPAYETAVATALASLNNPATQGMTFKRLMNMVYLAALNKVQPIVVDGKKLILVILDHVQALQLKQDTEYQTYLKDAGIRGKDNLIFTGQLEGTYIEGAYIIIDETKPCARISGDAGYDTSLGYTVQYGRTDYMSQDRDDGARRPAVVVGAGAVTCGYGDPLGFESETADYGQFKGDAADMIIGYERADIIDSDNYFGLGANTFYGNFSSFLYFTYGQETISSY